VARKIVWPEKVLVAQVVFSEIDVVRVYLANHIAIGSEELVKVAEKKVRDDVNASILKLHETQALRSERALQSL